MKLWQKVTLGLILGIICGVIFDEKVVYLKPIGDVFINLIKMVIVPLVFFSLVSGITSMSDPSSLGRIGIKASIAFISTTTFAILIGIGIALLLKPGEGMNLDVSSLDNSTSLEKRIFDPLKMFMNIIPTNAVAGFVNGEILQVVFFAIFTGVTISKLQGPEKQKLTDFFHTMAKLVFKMISIIMNFSPYGAFALTAWVIGTQGIQILHSLAKLIGTMMVAMMLQYLLFGLFIYVFARLSPIPFFKKSLEYQSLAFATSSSKAALATTMKVCTQNLGISQSSTSFILPLGASINMDGMAIYLGMCSVFFAQATGTCLNMHDYFIIIMTATLGSIGAAGIPGGSMVMLPMILSAINLPVAGVALIAGVDRILDMVRTTINITGDSTITLIIDKSEGKFNKDIYYS